MSAPILAVDTASGLASCAIINNNGNIIAFSGGTESSLQAEGLFDHIIKVLSEANLGYSDLGGFAVNLGPGSFTGIRIGLSAVTALCFALNKKLLGISSLEALAYNAWKEKGISHIKTALDAGREGAYFAEFSINESGLITASNDGELIDIKTLPACDIGNLPACITRHSPTAADIAIAAHYKIKNNIADFDRKTPIYIRKPDAKIKVKNNV